MCARGDLFTNSVIALHASTGKLAWYFQFTRMMSTIGTSTQTPVLADLVINGVVRKVICWPNRNGFYYVLDRVRESSWPGHHSLNWIGPRGSLRRAVRCYWMKPRYRRAVVLQNPS